MNYLEMFDLRRSENFRHRIIVAVVKAAQVILNEGGSVAKHAGRMRWAANVLAEPSQQAERMVWAIIGDATIQASGDAATDAQVQAAVDALVNQFIPEVTTNTVSDGTYTVGAKLTTGGVNGSVTVTNGVISAITQAS
jgi:hypothetical protein